MFLPVPNKGSGLASLTKTNEVYFRRACQSARLRHLWVEFDAHNLTYVLQMLATARVSMGVWQIAGMSSKSRDSLFEKQMDQKP